MPHVDHSWSVTMSDERNDHLPRQPDSGRARRYAELLTDAEFTHSVLANSTESIKVLDLDARIEFMSMGALRALEIEDEDSHISSSWLALWHDDAPAQAAVADAKAGRTAMFEGARSTLKGNPRWWEVTVSPILGAGGRPMRLLAISRDITERKVAHQSQDMVMQEMHHRVKNMLAMVMAIASQSLARAPSIAEGRLAVERRLMALAEAHNVLRDGGPDGTRLRDVVGAALSPCDGHPSRFDLAGDDLRLSPQAAFAVAMALHELCTNAVKYGALSVAAGRVELTWRSDGDRFQMTWRERGGPRITAPSRRGFGTRVIEAGFRDQLGGNVSAVFEPSGVVWTLEATVSALRDSV
jgi:PAS domain S-box-containing protein